METGGSCQRGGDLVAVEPKVFDLLAFVANRERVVTRDDLISAVWDGRSCRNRH